MRLQVYNLFLFMTETSENEPVLTREQLIDKIGPLGKLQFEEGLAEGEELGLLRQAAKIAEEVRKTMPDPRDMTRAYQIIRARVSDETGQKLKIYHPMAIGHHRGRGRGKSYPGRSGR